MVFHDLPIDQKLLSFKNGVVDDPPRKHEVRGVITTKKAGIMISARSRKTRPPERQTKFAKFTLAITAYPPDSFFSFLLYRLLI